MMFEEWSCFLIHHPKPNIEYAHIFSSLLLAQCKFRLANIQGTNVYNVVAMYDSDALDIWGRANYRICGDDFQSVDQKRAHETIAAAYAFAYSGIKIVPQVEEIIVDIMENVLNLPMSNLDGNPSVDTPWGLAKALVDEGDSFAKSDG
jgi:hypothetical protein